MKQLICFALVAALAYVLVPDPYNLPAAGVVVVAWLAAR
jgi:hypothetical protein